MAISGAAYRHTNLVARDWRRLADFYCRVFGCRPVPPERQHSGPWLDRLTGIEGAAIEGGHFRLPGHGDHGPTLEIFTYEKGPETPPLAINQPGFAHLCFTVDDVAAALDDVLAAGGGRLGEIVTTEVSGAGTVTLVYARDPEGNIVELQRWG